MKIGRISCKRLAIYGAINFGAINILLQKMEQFYGAIMIIWYHLMAPFYGMCVSGRVVNIAILYWYWQVLPMLFSVLPEYCNTF